MSIYLKLKEKFVKACAANDLSAVKTLYEKVKILKSTNPVPYNEIIAAGMSDAIEDGHLNIIKYLVENNSDELHLDGTLNAGMILYIASLYNQPEVVKYIVEEDKARGFNINVDESFKTAYELGFLDVIRVFIFDYNMQKNDTFVKCLYMGASGIAQDVRNMVKLRELNKTLSAELASSNQEHNKRMKV
jgi:hypothetical protein